MLDYLLKAFSLWFLGFVPFAEIIIAVPAGLAMGLDQVSVIIFSVAGNFTPVLLIEYGYTLLMRYQKIRLWLNRYTSERAAANINKYGLWYMLVITPWVGVWAMGAMAKMLNMPRKTFMWGAFISILVYAVVIVVLVEVGTGLFP
ncbi:MAG: small multi-drug export protein [Balneolales bacterium]